MTVGEKIREKRKMKGLTQTELGNLLGVRKNAVSKWECGRVEDIPRSKLKTMADLFDVPLIYLLESGEISEIDTDFEAAIMEAVRMLSDEDKKFVLEIVRYMRKRPPN